MMIPTSGGAQETITRCPKDEQDSSRGEKTSNINLRINVIFAAMIPRQRNGSARQAIRSRARSA
jgi:hypothetical protein